MTRGKELHLRLPRRRRRANVRRAIVQACRTSVGGRPSTSRAAARGRRSTWTRVRAGTAAASRAGADARRGVLRAVFIGRTTRGRGGRRSTPSWTLQRPQTGTDASITEALRAPRPPGAGGAAPNRRRRRCMSDGASVSRSAHCCQLACRDCASTGPHVCRLGGEGEGDVEEPVRGGRAAGQRGEDGRNCVDMEWTWRGPSRRPTRREEDRRAPPRWS